MADNPTNDDVYDDSDNILADTDDSVDGSSELPAAEGDGVSQSIFKPELGDDDRGTIPELEEADRGEDADSAPSELPDDETGSDAYHSSDVESSEERDNTEN